MQIELRNYNFRKTVLILEVLFLSACAVGFQTKRDDSSNRVASQTQVDDGKKHKGVLDTNLLLTRYIEAFCKNPADPATSNRLRRAAYLNGKDVRQFSFDFRSDLSVDEEGKYETNLDDTSARETELEGAWVRYLLAKIEWRLEHKQSDAASETVDEDVFALRSMLRFWEQQRRRNTELHNSEMELLKTLSARGFLEAFVYFERFSPESSAVFEHWEGSHHTLLVRYVREFLLVPVRTQETERRADENAADSSFHSGRSDENLSAEEIEVIEQRIQAILKAIDSATKSEAPAEEVAVLHTLMASNLLLLHQQDEAEKHIRDAIEIPNLPQDAEVRVLANILLGSVQARQTRYTDAVKTLEAVLKTPASTNSRIFYETARELAPVYVDLGRLRDASKLAQQNFMLSLQLNSSNDPDFTKQRDAAIRLLGKVYRLVFESISWNLISGRQREGSPDDFVNNGSVGSGDKYGARSPDEDGATFGTFVILECFPQKPGYIPCELTRHVRAQMEKGNFVPAAKYLYHRFVRPAFIPPEINGAGLVNGSRIDNSSLFRAMQNAQRGDLGAVFKILVDSGVILREEMEGQPTEPTGNQSPIDFAAVRAALADRSTKGSYVPPRISEIVEILGDAYEFAKSNKLLD